ncbi:undecaprenyldiphospho-muramoylpentapeptide beta-N-acetylglucosaminyltransferase [Desulfocurvus sp. DL9XJH121]
MRRVVITTGGTGGHVFPALAVAEELRRRHPEADILFVGGCHGREREFAEAAGLRFLGLPVRGVMGRGLRAVGALWGLGRAVVRCWWLMLGFKPEVVLGFGGYAGFAPVLAASMRGIPCAVHEQNSYPGSANRLLGRWVDRVFLSFPDGHGFFDAARAEITGNPVRGALVDLGEASGETREGGKRLLILGGSLGARPLNKAVCAALGGLREAGFEMFHQTGEADLAEVRAAYEAEGWTGPDARVEAFIRDMAGAYAWADLVLCRAGATTVAELAVTGKPSVLVPYPLATHDHQTANARYLEKEGAAVILAQNLLGEVNLAKSLDTLFTAPGRLTEMGRAARSLGRPRAAAVLADAVEALAEGKNRKEG